MNRRLSVMSKIRLHDICIVMGLRNMQRLLYYCFKHHMHLYQFANYS